MRLVLVEWLDSFASVGWQEVAGIDCDALPCCSVGWLVDQSETAIVLSPHLTEARDDVPEQGNGVMTIPLCAVTRTTDLREDS